MSTTQQPEVRATAAALEALDMGGAADDVQLLRMGYAAARLEIESLRKEHADELAVAYMCGASREQELSAQQTGAAYAALPDEGEPWRGHKFKEVQRGCWRCDCGKTIKEVTSDQSTPASGGNYPVMPKRYTVDDDGEELFTAEKMRAFADATCAMRASHGQAPAQPECLTCNDHGAVGNILTAEPCPDCTRKAAPAAMAGPSGYGPKVTVKRRCSDCKACNSESYAVQGDSGHYVYCEHPSLPERKYIGDTRWDTPGWCPAAAPTTQPTPAAQGDALTQAARDVLARKDQLNGAAQAAQGAQA